MANIITKTVAGLLEKNADTRDSHRRADLDTSHNVRDRYITPGEGYAYMEQYKTR